MFKIFCFPICSSSKHKSGEFNFPILPDKLYLNFLKSLHDTLWVVIGPEHDHVTCDTCIYSVNSTKNKMCL